MHTLPPDAQEAIRNDLERTDNYKSSEDGEESRDRRYDHEDTDTASIPASRGR